MHVFKWQTLISLFIPLLADLPQIRWFLNLCSLVRSLFSLMLSCVVHRWLRQKKKNILQSFYVNISLKDVSFFKMQQAWLFLWHAPQMKLLFFCFFGLKFSDGVLLLFRVICFPFPKIHALRPFPGISVEKVITALVCLCFSFFFPSPRVAQWRLSSCKPSNEYLIPQNVSDSGLLLWILLNIV